MTSLLNGQELLEELCELHTDLEDCVEDEEFWLDWESKWDDESDWIDPEVETYSSTKSVYMWWGKDKRDWCIYRYEGYKSRSGVGMDDESFKEMMGLIKRRGSFPDGWGYLESQYDLSLTIEQNFWLEGIENEYGDVHRKSFDNPDQWVANLQPKQMKP